MLESKTCSHVTLMLLMLRLTLLRLLNLLTTGMNELTEQALYALLGIYPPVKPGTYCKLYLVALCTRADHKSNRHFSLACQ